MKPFLINIHSAVDLITNSSSELFVCNTKKSVEAVKEIIAVLAENYNRCLSLSDREDHFMNPISLPALFTGVFREPEVSEFTFDLNKYPDHREFSSMWKSVFGWRNDDVHPIKAEGDEKMDRWEKDHPRPANDNANKWWNARCAAEREFYPKWTEFVRHHFQNLYTWVAEQNGVDLTPLGEPKSQCSAHAWLTYSKYSEDHPTPASRLVAAVNEALDWDFSFKKGDVFLRSSYDNSIPYEFWPLIENTFSTQRRHLG